MQFYLDGYKPGDPFIADPHPSVASRPSGPPEEVDVLIVGTGPAGLVLAAQLANFPDIHTVVVDRRGGPLDVGQADGVACRTVEIFETFGLARRLVEEAYWVNEVCFWDPDPEDRSRIRRAGRVRDTEEGLSEFPHVIVNQARMLAYLLDHMERSPSRLVPLYNLQATSLMIDESQEEYPVTVRLDQLRDRKPTGASSTIRAKYVVGCDGARSAIRSAIGLDLRGDAMNVSWGVMDALTVTDFPDIRFKCTIHSATEGSVLIIPREGGYLNRFYIELDTVRDGEILEGSGVTPEQLTAVANRIMHPYKLEVKDVGWFSIYEIGQRLTAKFDDVPADAVDSRLPRVFIAGDACHTHSAKAGQGMNVSMADTFNLGWKLASVLRGSARGELLHTYSQERQKIAQELIDFDHEMARLFSSRAAGGADAHGDAGVDPDEFRRFFIQQGRFTAGVATEYSPSLITSEAHHQHLATGYPVGRRFHSAPVVRLSDAKPLELGHVARADGAWRLYLFADQLHPCDPQSKLRALCDFLASDSGILARFTPPEQDPDSVIDVRAIFQQTHRELSPDDLPAVLLPRKGRFGLVDYEKAFCSNHADGDIFELRGIDRRDGCLVVVRPDQYVSDVLPLTGHQALADFFDRILLRAIHREPPKNNPRPTPSH